jgi:transcriptional regulator with XRE-family HTH domain
MADVEQNPDASNRAAEFRARLKNAGLTQAEFGRRAGLGRAVVWRLAKGGKRSAEQQRKIDSILGPADQRE